MTWRWTAVALAACLALLSAAYRTQQSRARSRPESPAAQAPGAVAEHRFRLERDGEAGLKLRAFAPGTSWREPRAEAAVLRIEVDGRYSQHVTLFRGAVEHEYRLLLGRLAAGEHRVRARLDRRLSSPGARGFHASFEVEPFVAESPEYEAIRRAPVLTARPNTLGRATDVPLLAYYEWLPVPAGAPARATHLLQYTWIFSNEDGGTNTPALMARWGRTVDTEYVYYALLDDASLTVGEIFQGVGHKDTAFRGRRVGDHPLLGIESDNNNFVDRPTSPVRFALWPERADLTGRSRESLLDRRPWIYRVMSEELEREGKLNLIADPRRFLYIEADIRVAGAAASFGVRLKNGDIHRSDRNDAGLRIDRSGWVRSALELPAGAAAGDIAELLYNCDQRAKPQPGFTGEPRCAVEAIPALFMLDDDYRPRAPRTVRSGLPASVGVGSSARLQPE